MILTSVTYLVYLGLLLEHIKVSLFKSLKLHKQRCNLYINKYNFCSRMIDPCNRLNQSILDSGITNTFKHNLDKYLSSRRFM